MALNRPLALHLFQQLRILNEWGQSIIMTVLARYKPEDEEEVFSILVRRDCSHAHSLFARPSHLCCLALLRAPFSPVLPCAASLRTSWTSA